MLPVIISVSSFGTIYMKTFIGLLSALVSFLVPTESPISNFSQRRLQGGLMQQLRGSWLWRPQGHCRLVLPAPLKTDNLSLLLLGSANSLTVILKVRPPFILLYHTITLLLAMMLLRLFW